MAQPLQNALELGRADPGAIAVDGGRSALTYGRLASDAETLAAGLRSGHGPVVIDGDGLATLTRFLGAALAGRPACVPHADFSSSERERALAQLAGLGDAADDDPIFYVGFTSGTSGAPKPFARRWSSWELSFGAAAEIHRIDRGTTVVLAGALAHSHFLFGAVLGLERGATLRTFARFDAGEVLSAAAGAEKAVLFVVPTMLAAIEPLIGETGYDQVTAVIVSGSAFDARHREIARRAFSNARIVQIFGASELSFVTVAIDEPGGAAPGDDVGTAFPGVEIELRGDAGEIWVRSPYLFAGHVTADGELDDTRDDRGFATVGDLGRIDDEGRLMLVGRGSNMVITGGKNVHPEEIEAVLREHDAVVDCVVVGVPDDYWGERLVALLEPRRDASDEELTEAVRARLASYKAPKEWRRVDALPRTATGKVARARARELVLDD